jgi:glycosyltransferase involved in cell wall biosynthesis
MIAVDDASTDSTPEILRALAQRDPRVRLVRNQKNLRLPGALNVGFDEARGRLWTWTSDDNLYRPGALRRMADALDARGDVHVVHAGYALIDAQGRETERREAGDLRHLGYSNVVGPCFLYRPEVHRALSGYSEDCFLAEDYDFWLRAASRFRFLRIPEDLYLYRVHEAALASSKREAVQTMVEAVLLRHVEHLPRRMRAGAWARLEQIARRRGDVGAARHRAIRHFRHAPLEAMRAATRRLLGRDAT